MKLASLRWVLPLGPVVLVAASCSGARAHTGADPISYGEWCSMVCDKTASKTSSSCGASVIDASACRGTCERGRGDTLSRRTYDEANTCVAYIDSLSCEGLGAAVGGSMVGQGEYAERCTAR